VAKRVVVVNDEHGSSTKLLGDVWTATIYYLIIWPVVTVVVGGTVIAFFIIKEVVILLFRLLSLAFKKVSKKNSQIRKK
jgi:hypothetical protein